MRRVARGAFALLLLAGPAYAVSTPAEMLPDQAQEARAERIGAALRCLVCQNESIEDSGADLARDLRHIVRVKVAAGDSDAAIMRWMVSRYGAFIALRPRLGWSTLLLWAMPALAVAGGMLAAAIGIGRQPPPPAPLEPEEQARLAELMR